MDRSNFAAKLCQNRNNTVAAPGFSCPIPMPRPFDTETDSDSDPDLASPLTFSDSSNLRVYCSANSRYRSATWPV
ncbi:MAG: hypothetical protein ACOX52_00440 [Verrucomicrobiota bacterium]